MCFPVICTYACNHSLEVVYRCRALPDNATQGQFSRCMARELRINGGHRDYYINSPCPECEEEIRLQRREARRRARAAASAMALAAVVQPRRALPAGQDRENMGRAAVGSPSSGNSNTTQGSGEERAQREAQAVARQERIRRLRPLETNFLQNIGRRSGGADSPELTPSQIWRFTQ